MSHGSYTNAWTHFFTSCKEVVPICFQMIMDCVVPEKHQVVIATHLGKLTIIDRKCYFLFMHQIKMYARNATGSVNIF